MSGWRIVTMRGGSGTLTHPLIAVAPGCPDTRHPTRDCGCRVFRTRAQAEAYIAEQEQARRRPCGSQDCGHLDCVTPLEWDRAAREVRERAGRSS